MGRECGSCTACCTLATVPELGKAAGVRCRYCDRGCSIYPQRPRSCQEFECAWLRGELPDWMKPDAVGVMIERLPSGHIALALPLHPHWLTPEIQDALKKTYQDRGVAVVARFGDKVLALLPCAVTADEVERGINSFAKSVGVI